MEKRDYYQVLGVPRQANEEELKKAYIAEEWTGEELDFITIKEPVK